MTFDLSKIEFTRKDINDKIRLPTTLDETLAHFLGIHLGDGHLNKRKSDYRIVYDGHYINEYSWYFNFLTKMIKNLFNKNVKPTKGHNTIRISFSSKAIHTYLNRSCGMPIGSKKDCNMPQFIQESSVYIKRAFLRGLADTDFSLVFKNRHKDINYYPVIDHQTSNRKLHRTLVKMLKELGFSVHAGERMKKRKDKAYPSFYFQVNGLNAFEKWMKEIGFTNNNQLTKIEVWRKLGYLPPNTNILDRLSISKQQF